MTRRIARCPAGDAPSRGCAVRVRTVDAAKRNIAAALHIPPWTYCQPQRRN